MKFSSSEKSAIQTDLIKWFKENQRDLPWRNNYDPYQVWISEIMLQQTQVATVLPYFERWMKTLPSIRSVAEAPEDQVLKLWEGLGYYSRARNLQKAAKMLVELNNGEMFQDFEKILGLPGVGRYTAGAIASIAFNQQKPLVDGNVIRVISRLRNFDKNTRLPENLQRFWDWSEQLVPKKDARYFNQGLMELGAMVCKPQNPNCDACPLRTNCKANAKGTQSSLPNRGQRTKSIPIKVAIAVIYKNGKVFIQKRPPKGLMAGLWEFPGGKVEKNETPLKAVKREVGEEVGLKMKNLKLIKKIKHGYTKFSVDLHCYRADFDSGDVELKSASDGKWVELSELADYPFPVANLKLIEDLV